MQPTRHNAARLLIMALALVLIALACGPTSPVGQDEPTPTPTIFIIGDASPSELATAMAEPTATPLPTDYVRPTHIPTVPPLTDAEIGATLAARLTREAAERNSGIVGAADVAPTPSPTPMPLTEQVTQFAREKQGRYDVVARVRAGASRIVSVPDNVVWPHNTKPWGENNLTRTPITAVTTYYGTLPAGYELVTPESAPNAALDVGQEYVIFIRKAFAGDSSESQCSGVLAPGQRCYNQAQLDAIGGPGGFYYGAQFWIVDGAQSWRIPSEHIRTGPAGPDLIVAKAGGESLLLSDLATAIQKGLPE